MTVTISWPPLVGALNYTTKLYVPHLGTVYTNTPSNQTSFTVQLSAGDKVHQETIAGTNLGNVTVVIRDFIVDGSGFPCRNLLAVRSACVPSNLSLIATLSGFNAPAGKFDTYTVNGNYTLLSNNGTWATPPTLVGTLTGSSAQVYLQMTMGCSLGTYEIGYNDATSPSHTFSLAPASVMLNESTSLTGGDAATSGSFATGTLFLRFGNNN